MAEIRCLLYRLQAASRLSSQWAWLSQQGRCKTHQFCTACSKHTICVLQVTHNYAPLTWQNVLQFRVTSAPAHHQAQ